MALRVLAYQLLSRQKALINVQVIIIKGNYGQINGESCARTFLAVHPDFSTAIFNDPMSNVKPQASSFAHRLGSKESIENLV
jgi:hypothetical protein